VRFWDASAIVPILIHEPGHDQLADLLRRDWAVAVWWTTPLECASALSRAWRERRIDQAASDAAVARLAHARTRWVTVAPSEGVLELAIRLVRVHSLRAGDALQLAAALQWVDGVPGGRSLVTGDQRLAAAAKAEGFTVLP